MSAFNSAIAAWSRQAGCVMTWRNSNVIDYQIAVAPALRGFIPVFSYNFRTRSLGLGIEVKGITF